ncbi:hypothetical protein Tco_1435555, partial [Tanacetum coccineum]
MMLHMMTLSPTEAGYMTLTEAVKGAIWLKGLAIESGFELKIVAGIATGALSKAVPRSSNLSTRYRRVKVLKFFDCPGPRQGVEDLRELLHKVNSQKVKWLAKGKNEGFAGTARISYWRSDWVLREVTKEMTAAGIRKKIETLYMTKSLANRLYLNKKLYTFHMHPGKSQSEHIDEFHKLVSDLAAIDTAISNEDQAFLILTSLPSSYDNLMETLLNGRDTMKLEDVLAILNSRELQKMTKAKSDGGEGLYVRGRSGQNRYGAGNEDQVFCSGDDGYGNADVIMAMSVEELLDWIMDSGSSYYITYRRDYLVDFKWLILKSMTVIIYCLVMAGNAVYKGQ